MSGKYPSLNYARDIAARSFGTVLSRNFGAMGVTEASFAEEWVQLLCNGSAISANGWYCPPPQGVAVLAASDSDPDRVNFRSLREEASWPSDLPLDWDAGLLYAYCSPVNLDTGLAGDFAVTLYFGSSRPLLNHFRNARRATKAVLKAVNPGMASTDLYLQADAIFAEHGLFNSVTSVTDVVPNDLGHTLPSLRGTDLHVDSIGRLSETTMQLLSRGRRFINDRATWELSPDLQITIEPQLRSLTDPSLPQISFHYVVVMTPFTVLAQPDRIMAEFRRWNDD